LIIVAGSGRRGREAYGEYVAASHAFHESVHRVFSVATDVQSTNDEVEQ